MTHRQPQERDGVMEIVTSWMEEGIEKGERRVILRQLRKRVGQIDRATEDQIAALPSEQLEQFEDALLDFEGREDLAAWLETHR